MGRSKKDKIVWTGMPSNEGDLKAIKTALLSTHESFRTIDNEREQLTDIFSELHAKYGIPKRVFNKLARFTYYNNANEQFSKDAEIQEAWEAIDKI